MTTSGRCAGLRKRGRVKKFIPFKRKSEALSNATNREFLGFLVRELRDVFIRFFLSKDKEGKTSLTTSSPSAGRWVRVRVKNLVPAERSGPLLSNKTNRKSIRARVRKL